MTANHEHFVDVRVVTTSGSFPKKSFDRHPINQPVKVVLHKAAEALKITNTADWIARVGDPEIDHNKSYAENKLNGEVIIDYGPKEGGGGNA